MKEKNEKYKFKENTCTFDHVFFIIQKAKYYEVFLDGNIYILQHRSFIGIKIIDYRIILINGLQENLEIIAFMQIGRFH